MTPEIRAEVAEYCRKALEIEKVFQKPRKSEVDSESLDREANSTLEPKQSKSHDEHNITDRRNSFTLETSSLGHVVLPCSTSPANSNDIHQKSQCSDDDLPRPRIIRSNSYTIDSPSPLLIKHLHNQSLDVKSSCSMGEIPISVPTKHVKKLDFEKDVQSKTQKNASAKPKWEMSKKASISKPLTPPKKCRSPYESLSKSSLKTSNKAKPRTPKKNGSVSIKPAKSGTAIHSLLHVLDEFYGKIDS